MALDALESENSEQPSTAVRGLRCIRRRGQRVCPLNEIFALYERRRFFSIPKKAARLISAPQNTSENKLAAHVKGR